MEDNKLNKESKNPPVEMPDDEISDELNRRLWVLLKKSEDFDESEDLQLGDLNRKFEAIDSLENSGIKDQCLTFSRCAEIGQKKTALAETEKTHLKNCRFCERRIEKFGGAPALAETVVSTENAESLPVEKSRWTDIFSKLGKFSIFDLVPRRLVFAGLALIVLSVAAIVVFRYDFNNSDDRIAIITDAGQNVPKIIYPENSDTPTPFQPVENPDNSNGNSINSPNKKIETVPNNKNSENPPVEEIEDYSTALAFLSNNEREAVRQSIQVGRIEISKDVEMLNEEARRGGTNENESGFVRQISPKNAATLETRPVLHWQGSENGEYRVTILDRGMKKIAESGVLTGNRWQPDKSLPPGFYFWEIAVRKKGATAFETTENSVFFKVVGGAETAGIERAKKATGSNLVSAILYARAGLFAEAERELNIELRKNPKSAKAQRMLTQIRRWKSK